MGRQIKHESLRWNGRTAQWFCTKCGRTSDQFSERDAQGELNQYECNVESVGDARPAPGDETTRLRKAYKMAQKAERSGIRFVAKTDGSTPDSKPVIQLDLFHDTVSGLRSLSVGFELLSGTTLEQARTLVDSMNERIVGIIVMPK